jgi:hypothetical protein
MDDGQEEHGLEGEAAVEWEPGYLFNSSWQEGTVQLLLMKEDMEGEEDHGLLDHGS